MGITISKLNNTWSSVSNSTYVGYSYTVYSYPRSDSEKLRLKFKRSGLHVNAWNSIEWLWCDYVNDWKLFVTRPLMCQERSLIKNEPIENEEAIPRPII